MSEYSSSLTIHGLNWFITGNILEKLVWSPSILGVLIFSIYMINEYVKHYLSFDIRTEIRYEENPSVILPTIVFCLSRSVANMMICYQNSSLHDHYPCDLNYTNGMKLDYWNSSNATWLPIGKDLGHGCRAINVDKSMSLTGIQELVAIRLQSNLSASEQLEIGFLSHEEFQIRKDQVPMINFFYGNVLFLKPAYYALYVSQTRMERLPHPYPSNCSNEHQTPNPISEYYTHSACYKVCLMNRYLEQCGDVPDFFQKYYSNSSDDNWQTRDNRNCLNRVLKYFNLGSCHCPLACDETIYKVQDEKVADAPKNESYWEFYFYIADRKVTHIHEVPDYTIADVLGAAGGILGLAIGASILSVVELIVVFILNIARKLY